MNLYVMLFCLILPTRLFLLFTAACPFLQPSLATYVTNTPFGSHSFLLKHNVSVLFLASYLMDHIEKKITVHEDHLRAL